MPHARSGLRRTTSFVSVSIEPAPVLEPFSTDGFSRPATLDACLALLRDASRREARRRCDGSRRRVEPVRAPLAASDQPRRDRRASGVFQHLRARHDWRRSSAERDRPALDRRARRVSRVARALRLAADSQPRDDRRQSRHRIADRRRGADAARPRRDRARRRIVRAAIDSAVVVLHRLPQDGHGARRADRRPSRFRSRCRSSCASTRSRSGGSTTSARSPRRWRSMSIRTARCGARGSRSAASRRRPFRAAEAEAAVIDQPWNDAAVERVQAHSRPHAAADERSSRVEGISPRGVEVARREVSVGARAVKIARHACSARERPRPRHRRGAVRRRPLRAVSESSSRVAGVRAACARARQRARCVAGARRAGRGDGAHAGRRARRGRQRREPP